MTSNLQRYISEEYYPVVVKLFNEGWFGDDYSAFFNKEYIYERISHYFQMYDIKPDIYEVQIEKGAVKGDPNIQLIYIKFPTIERIYGRTIAICIVVETKFSKALIYNLEYSFDNEYSIINPENGSHIERERINDPATFIHKSIELAWGDLVKFMSMHEFQNNTSTNNQKSYKKASQQTSSSHKSQNNESNSQKYSDKKTNSHSSTEKQKDSRYDLLWVLGLSFVGITLISLSFTELFSQFSPQSENNSNFTDSITAIPVNDSVVIDIPSEEMEPLLNPEDIKTFNNGERPYEDWFGEGYFNANFNFRVIVENNTDYDAIAVLYSDEQKVIRHGYINKHSSYSFVGLPAMTGIVKFMHGNDWYKFRENGSDVPNGAFTQHLSFSVSKEKIKTNNSNKRSTIRINMDKNGNFSTTHSSANEFFKNE